MGNFFVKDWNGAPFELFGTAHLIGLAFIALVNVYLVYFRDHSSAVARRNFRYGLAVVLLLNEIAWHLWNWATGQWTLQTMLPLHLCSVLVWLSAYMVISKELRHLRVRLPVGHCRCSAGPTDAGRRYLRVSTLSLLPNHPLPRSYRYSRALHDHRRRIPPHVAIGAARACGKLPLHA